jgi:hypothetical protein
MAAGTNALTHFGDALFARRSEPVVRDQYPYR